MTIKNYYIFFLLVFIFIGAGCAKNPEHTNIKNENKELANLESDAPFGFIRYEKGALSFLYPENLTINDDVSNDENFDWESNIIINITTVDKAEKECYIKFGERYVDSPAETPTKDLLSKLKDNGLTPSNYNELLRLDTASCNGWAWSPLRALPLNKNNVNGMVTYGCAGNSGDCTVDMNWVTYTGVDESDNVYVITLRPIFGRLANRMFPKITSQEESIAMNDAMSAVMLRGSVFDYNQYSYIASDLLENLDVINDILGSISYN